MHRDCIDTTTSAGRSARLAIDEFAEAGRQWDAAVASRDKKAIRMAGYALEQAEETRRMSISYYLTYYATHQV
jgi:hypothetical protein